MTVDVKSTDNFSGNLLVPLYITSDNFADALVLMRGTLEKGFEYVGWIKARVTTKRLSSAKWLTVCRTRGTSARDTSTTNQ